MDDFNLKFNQKKKKIINRTHRHNHLKSDTLFYHNRTTTKKTHTHTQLNLRSKTHRLQFEHITYYIFKNEGGCQQRCTPLFIHLDESRFQFFSRFQIRCVCSTHTLYVRNTSTEQQTVLKKGGIY